MLATTARWFLVACVALALGACASTSMDKSAAKSSENAWTTAALEAALATPSRPEADRARDADRKPAQLMQFFGVKQGMTALDVMASGGYMTEVLSITVGPKGKVYAENPLPFLQYNNGMYAKLIAKRLENNRLPNAQRLDGDIGALPPNSVDVAITIMNLHDVYNTSPEAAKALVKSVYDALKPGGVFGVVDHVGLAGADNAKLHRMQKQQALDLLRSVGFVFEDESSLLAHPNDDHTKFVFDPSIRGKTDQFSLRMRKPR